MKKLSRTPLGLLLLFVSFVLVAASTRVLPSEIDYAEVAVKGKTSVIACYEGVPGKVITKADAILFKDFGSRIKRARKKYKADRSTKNKRRFQKARSLNKAGKQACSQVSDPIATPTPDPSPSPTPDPDGDGGDDDDEYVSYFYQNGDVNPLGREVFAIPDQFTSNFLVGEAVFVAKECTACHEKRTKPTYGTLEFAIRNQMFFTEQEVSDQDIADLTAYLNLYRSPLRE